MNTRTVKEIRTQLRYTFVHNEAAEMWAIELGMPKVERRAWRFSRLARILGWFLFLRRYGHAPGVWGLHACACSPRAYSVQVEEIARLLVSFQKQTEAERAQAARYLVENSAAVIQQGVDVYQMVSDVLSEATTLSMGGRAA